MSEPLSAPNYRRLQSASEAASNAKRRNLAKGTKPELLLRQRLWALGLRYRLHRSDLPGKPDLVFARQRVVVFIDGDFWHGRDWLERKARLGKGHNAGYWQAKIEYNMERDCLNTRLLERAGWRVIRLWEGLIRASADATAGVVAEALGAGLPKPNSPRARLHRVCS
jgi:DNA mismatch endonuclease (patch repair protein)